jgi:hypothetical protein
MWQVLLGFWLYVAGFVVGDRGVTATVYWRGKLGGFSDVTDYGYLR